MHASVLTWLQFTVSAHGIADASVLEVGSLDVNGSARQFFGGPYIGVDFRPGPGVDLVANAHRLPFPDASFDVVVCTEMLEHDSAFWLSLAEMGRVLKPGGHILLTARGNGFPEHAYPEDYWRFMPQAMPELAALAGCVVVEGIADPGPPGFCLHGVRR